MNKKLSSVGLMLFMFLWVLPVAAAQWANTYGGSSDDYAYSIQQTSDGGYIVAGYTNSFGAGGTDAWVLKLDANGNVQWQKTYGGSSDDYAYSIQQTSDGGYIVAGYTESFGAGYADVWVLKLDANGNVQWQKTYGGSGWDEAYSIQRTLDGGYIVAGWTDSFGAGGTDAWVLKLDANGNVQWQKTYGGTYDDYANSIQQTSDGGYIVAGRTYSFGAGGTDVWVLKLDSSGNVQWQKTYGGTYDDYANSIQQTSDGGYIVAGVTKSFRAGNADVWVLKLDASGNVQWQKIYGYEPGDFIPYSRNDSANSIQQTSDGGYIVASYGNFGLDRTVRSKVLKLDANGNVQWHKTYGGYNYDSANSIQQTSDGGYIVAGVTKSFGAGNADVWVLKLDSNGKIADCSAEWGSYYYMPTSTTNLSGVNSSAGVTSTSVKPGTSNATIKITTVSPGQVCYYSALQENIVGVGDFNGDGKADILWRNSSTGVVTMWLMDGTNMTSWAPIVGSGNTDWTVAGVGDFNGDGKADILWRNSSTGMVTMWIMDGTNMTNWAVIVGAGNTDWTVAGVGDFNGDGKADILWRNTSTGMVTMWIMDGTNMTRWAVIVGAGNTDWTVAGVGDFNGDGKADILWRNSSTGMVTMWIMDGTNMTRWAVVVGSGNTDWTVAGVGDFNGDRKADILWRNTSTGMVTTWLMDGTSMTNWAVLVGNGNQPWNIAGTGKFDADSNFDILWRNNSTGMVTMWFMNGTSLKSWDIVVQ